jgi:hypothetical protein
MSEVGDSYGRMGTDNREPPRRTRAPSPDGHCTRTLKPGLVQWHVPDVTTGLQRYLTESLSTSKSLGNLKMTQGRLIALAIRVRRIRQRAAQATE